jgi:NADP-dependent 3-hydroxy acid dehydrogenase YdfG
MELTNKVAVITGASSGIGAAVARNLNEVGVNLVLTGRRENRLVELKKELTCAEILPGDITNPALPNNLIQMALQTSL